MSRIAYTFCMKYDLLHIQGKSYVLVPLHDYRAMTGSEQTGALPDHVLDMLAARQDNPIKIIRKFRGLTQSELSKKAKISRPYLAEIETGRKDGSLRALKSIADALNVSPDSLI